jgi:hypothetical protein
VQSKPTAGQAPRYLLADALERRGVDVPLEQVEHRFLDRALGRRPATVVLAELREGAADREPVAEAVEDAPPTAAGALGASLDSRLVLLRSC